jgi:hypothetical protein
VPLIAIGHPIRFIISLGQPQPRHHLCQLLETAAIFISGHYFASPHCYTSTGLTAAFDYSLAAYFD